jgi:2,3-dihydroxyphenylpropionate 1,2-dioxygenase
MASIVGCVAFSHSPFWDLSFDVSGPGETFVHGVTQARELARRLAPDAFVIFGPDHFRNFFYDVLPPFCIGVNEVEGIGDYGLPKRALPGASGLGAGIYQHVIEHGFDPAVSMRMGVDHGITQPYVALDPETTTPFVPIMINCSGAPRPSLKRCYDFGKAVGSAIEAYPENLRVLILASGGMSHWIQPVSLDNPSTSAETRDYVINGRARSAEYTLARNASLAARKKEKVTGRVNAEWDQWFLAALTGNDLESLFAIDPGDMEEKAGNGAHELRTWIAAAGAWHRPLRTMAYEPVPSWVTGMGCIAGQ